MLGLLMSIIAFSRTKNLKSGSEALLGLIHLKLWMCEKSFSDAMTNRRIFG